MLTWAITLFLQFVHSNGEDFGTNDALHVALSRRLPQPKLHIEVASSLAHLIHAEVVGNAILLCLPRVRVISLFMIHVSMVLVLVASTLPPVGNQARVMHMRFLAII